MYCDTYFLNVAISLSYIEFSLSIFISRWVPYIDIKTHTPRTTQQIHTKNALKLIECYDKSRQDTRVTRHLWRGSVPVGTFDHMKHIQSALVLHIVGVVVAFSDCCCSILALCWFCWACLLLLLSSLPSSLNAYLIMLCHLSYPTLFLSFSIYLKLFTHAREVFSEL